MRTLTLALTLFSLQAHAADSVTMDAVRHVAFGYDNPKITFHSHTSGTITAELTCSGKRFSQSAAVADGDDVVLTLRDLPQGTHACKGTLTLRGDDGSQGSMPLSLEVGVYAAPTLRVDEAELDLTARTLTLRSDRFLRSAELQVYGPNNEAIGSGRADAGGRDMVQMDWYSDGEIVKIEVVATDVNGIKGKLVLLPWSYNIPHEDVIFATNEHGVEAAEVHKLETAWSDLQGVLTKYGEVVEVQLYVAGYTDTAGSAESNQGLSDRRARSIATWFRERGFKGPVWFQGLGETAPAVATGDGVDEARNRRALYILAARPPSRSSDIPRGNWHKL